METFCYETKEGVTYGYFPVLREMGFENAFTCMEGGESAILPHTLNMALHVGDEAALVIRNREKAARALSISLDRTVTCAQIHGSQIAVVDAAQAGRGARDFGTTLAGVDGLASGEKDLPLMLFLCGLYAHHDCGSRPKRSSPAACWLAGYSGRHRAQGRFCHERDVSQSAPEPCCGHWSFHWSQGL